VAPTEIARPLLVVSMILARTLIVGLLCGTVYAVRRHETALLETAQEADATDGGRAAFSPLFAPALLSAMGGPWSGSQISALSAQHAFGPAVAPMRSPLAVGLGLRSHVDEIDFEHEEAGVPEVADADDEISPVVQARLDNSSGMLFFFQGQVGNTTTRFGLRSSLISREPVLVVEQLMQSRGEPKWETLIARSYRQSPKNGERTDTAWRNTFTQDQAAVADYLLGTWDCFAPTVPGGMALAERVQVLKSFTFERVGEGQLRVSATGWPPAILDPVSVKDSKRKRRPIVSFVGDLAKKLSRWRQDGRAPGAGPTTPAGSPR